MRENSHQVSLLPTMSTTPYTSWAAQWIEVIRNGAVDPGETWEAMRSVLVSRPDLGERSWLTSASDRCRRGRQAITRRTQMLL